MTDIRAFVQNMQNGSNGAAAGSSEKAPAKGSKQVIEKMYQKKSQLEHILLRPDTYIGSVERVTENMWVAEKVVTEEKTYYEMVQREISYVPGLYKIFDEILVNAADNKQRDPKMTTIKIDINQEENKVEIYNNGLGIPVVMHKEEKMYVPTMIFGHLLTSSNYNDEEEKVTGGRNGYGAKLCNIFSTKFVVETASKEYKKRFKQTWMDNMGKTSEPKLDAFGKEEFTKVSFWPDLKKFKMDKLEDDIVALMQRRAFDVAASTRGVSVYLNGQKLGIKNFKDYIDMYIKKKDDESGNPLKISYENCNERWEVALTLSDRGFQQVSFVNSIATTKGGRHVDYVADMIVKQVMETIKKKNKGGVNIKPFQVKNHMWIFINCLVVNPTFDSQTKENMTLQSKSFGSKCTLSEKFIGSIMKSGIVESVLTWAKFKAQTELAKTSGAKKSKLKGIPKLEDANDAGTKNSVNCTLILTEGDSAKTLAVSGLGVVGRDLYGVFPLRGKLLNVRDATHKQILENAEINNLIKILGLQYKKKYNTQDDVKTLRYGKLMIMTDQDQDGSHIKGLLINFIHTNWPELLRLKFLEEFITPIVKVTKKNQELSFFSIPEFEEWKRDTPNAHTFSVKYYKGLGTSTSKEAKEYFQNMDRHRILFQFKDDNDDEAIRMAFSKSCVQQRKDWLTKHMEECKHRKLVGLPERYLYTKTTKDISYADFVNLELILFSNTDNIRSIPCVVDGFKPGQRKIIFTCLKRNDKKEVKVAQLAGSVAEQSAYHHGEVSLCSTIVNLAQNYVGSNNINLLQPNGQFGTRLSGGKDSASPRYIFTMLSPLARLIFHPHDDPLLNFLDEDNQRIEPEYYVPIIPMVLVNGAEGIGTGWSTKIPCHNPREIISNLRNMMNGEEPKPMIPWYKNFKGEIVTAGDGRFVTVGCCATLDGNKLEISELPIGTWTQNYKESLLEPLLHGGEKTKAVISDYKEYNTDTTVRFVISFLPGEFDKLLAEPGGFHRVFKLTSSVAITSMHSFDHNNCLRRYESSAVILKEFYALRLEYYEKRKKYLEGMLQAEADKLSNQARFIQMKCSRELVVENKKRKVMIDELIRLNFKPDPVKEWKRSIKADDAEDFGDDQEEQQEEVEEKPGKSSKKPVDPEKAFQSLSDVKKFDYLLGMSMWMLTDERKEELIKQQKNKLNELNTLKKKEPKHLWIEDLDALNKKLDEVEQKERDEEEKMLKSLSKSKASQSSKQRNIKSFAKADDTKPSVHGDRVRFELSAEMLKKYEKATALSKGIKKEKAIKSEPGEEMDEFDALVAGDGDSSIKKEKPEKVKKPRVKKEPGEVKPKKEKGDGMKQTKLDFKKKGKKKAGSDESDIEAIGSGSEDEFDALVKNTAPREKTARRAATKKIDYSFLKETDEEKSDDSEPEMFDNVLEKSIPTQAAVIDNSDFEPEKSDEETPIKKPPAKRKLGPKPAPKRKIESSGSEASPVKKKQPQKKQKKKNFDSSDESDNVVIDDSDSDFDG
ncbi:DNA topoisomerase 2 isoform X1 [Chironomus tepperi]|uniref:DNA topoisomerase 2 isoform X1 n=2 Tax=Chironomus tepperi TaxID=113505 RepID=UPI00391FA7F1